MADSFLLFAEGSRSDEDDMSICDMKIYEDECHTMLQQLSKDKQQVSGDEQDEIVLLESYFEVLCT